MITVISGTNRQGSVTRKVATHYTELLIQKGQKAQLFSLEDLPHTFAFSDLYGKRSSEFQQQLDQFIVPVNRFVALLPEYNGTFPGIFKLFFDGIHPDLLRGKKIGLVGIANGRGGNLRGLDQLTAAIHYLNMYVYPRHLPLSLMKERMDEKGQFKQETIQALANHVQGMIDF
jgi:NAD(P)H-dependent FMN reductase